MVILWDMRPAVLVCGLVLFFTSSALFGQQWGLGELAAELSSQTMASARFTETKQMEMLETPLLLKGTLLYRAPDYVRKEVFEPYAEIFEINGEQLTYQKGAKQRSLSLDEHPTIRAFAEAFRATLAGNLNILQQYFKLVLSGDRSQWTLRLEPLGTRLRTAIDAIVISGTGARPLTIKTLERDGTTSILDILPDDR